MTGAKLAYIFLGLSYLKISVLFENILNDQKHHEN